MNLNPLFPAQKKLMKKIEDEHDLHKQDLKKKKIVSMLAELFEAVNEARFFKYWSRDQKARTKKVVKCHSCNGKGYYSMPFGAHETCGYCDNTGIQEEGNPLLEEYADVIHTMLTIALEYGYTEHEYKQPTSTDLSDRVIDITYLVASLSFVQEKVRRHQISLIFDYVISLGYQFGFTEKEVIAAYLDKNKINHERQNTGY